MLSMRKLPAENLIENLRMLLEKSGIPIKLLAQKSGVSKRMIDYILAGERKAGVDIAGRLAEPFGISGWQLIMPNLQWEIAKGGELDALIENYNRSSADGRGIINSVAEREAKLSFIEGEYKVLKEEAQTPGMVLIKNSMASQGSQNGKQGGKAVRVQKPRASKAARKAAGSGEAG